MKNILVVGAVVLPLLALIGVQESPEKSSARGDFFYDWCLDNAPEGWEDDRPRFNGDNPQRFICHKAAQRIRDKEATLSSDLERKFQDIWEKSQRKF